MTIPSSTSNSAGGACLVCDAGTVTPLLDLGRQPILNRYLSSQVADEETFPFTFGCCEDCGLSQLTQLIAPVELQPRYGWIRYREPEYHVDSYVNEISSRCGLDARSALLGVTSFDTPVLEKLAAQRCGSVKVLRPADDLGTDDQARIATIQQHVTPETARAFVDKYGAADFVSARYILEHAHSPLTFLTALRILTKPSGWILMEVPDCSPVFESLDYSKLWEEHVLYFTADTLSLSMTAAGLSPQWLGHYPRADSFPLVMLARNVAEGVGDAPRDPRTSLASARQFASRRPARAAAIRTFLKEVGHSGPVALLGAGHESGAFVNALGMAPALSLIVDDDQRKHGLYMPGSRLPIHGSAALVDRSIGVCLLGVSPESEEAVMNTHASFTRRGGLFYSIFPHRATSMPVKWAAA